jgi:hypothetical protein
MIETTEEKAIRLKQENAHLKNVVAEQDYLLDTIARILDGQKVSDFALSFPIVTQVTELKREVEHLRSKK